MNAPTDYLVAPCLPPPTLGPSPAFAISGGHTTRPRQRPHPVPMLSPQQSIDVLVGSPESSSSTLAFSSLAVVKDRPTPSTIGKSLLRTLAMLTRRFLDLTSRCRIRESRIMTNSSAWHGPSLAIRQQWGGKCLHEEACVKGIGKVATLGDENVRLCTAYLAHLRQLVSGGQSHQLHHADSVASLRLRYPVHGPGRTCRTDELIS